MIAAVVVATLNDFEHRAAHHGVDTVVEEFRRERLRLTAEVERAGGVLLASDAHSVIAVFETAAAALDGALSAGDWFSVGLTLGKLTVDGEHAWGLPYARALRLAGFGERDISCGNELLRALDLPDGVGVFRAPEHREAASGHPTHILRDYR